MKIDLTLHSFTMTQHFRHAPGFDVYAFVDLAERHGLQGISLSLNDINFRHLGGTEPGRMDRLRARLERSGLSLEIDTSCTEPAHLRKMIGVAARIGAQSLRTYTRHCGTPQQMAEATVCDLAAVVEIASGANVVIVLENHEDFTGPELAGIVKAVGHPFLRILYDYGNAQMVLEDPEEALMAVLPYVYSVHVKDHVMVHADHAGVLTVAGVPIGEGAIPIRRITRRLLDHGLRRFTFENVWAYAAGIRPGRTPRKGVVLGNGSFRWQEPPFDPNHIVLDVSSHSAKALVRMEASALERGMRWFKDELRGMGCSGGWDQNT